MFNFRKRPRNDETLRCSFCNKSQDEIGSLISTPEESPVRAYICNECVAVRRSIFGIRKEGKIFKVAHYPRFDHGIHCSLSESFTEFLQHSRRKGVRTLAGNLLLAFAFPCLQRGVPKHNLSSQRPRKRVPSSGPMSLHKIVQQKNLRTFQFGRLQTTHDQWLVVSGTRLPGCCTAPSIARP